jgi:hypothetical protein
LAAMPLQHAPTYPLSSARQATAHSQPGQGAGAAERCGQQTKKCAREAAGRSRGGRGGGWIGRIVRPVRALVAVQEAGESGVFAEVRHDSQFCHARAAPAAPATSAVPSAPAAPRAPAASRAPTAPRAPAAHAIPAIFLATPDSVDSSGHPRERAHDQLSRTESTERSTWGWRAHEGWSNPI